MKSLGGRWRLAAWAVPGLGAGVLACSALPERAPELQPLPPRQAAQQVTMLDSGGRVSAATRASALAQVSAEGGAQRVQHHLGVLTAAGEVHLYRDNSARLLVDGPATFAAMKTAIAAARHRVLVETYIFEDEGVPADIGDLLISKSAEGVQVALLYDAVGSLATTSEFFERLRSGGVLVCAFNPVNPLNRPGHWGLSHRNHRKMLAVDSDVAHTGGINLSDVYSAGSFGGRGRRERKPAAEGSPPRGWRDTQIELRGPVVAAMAALFEASWRSQGCEGTLAPTPAPRVQAAGQRVVKLVAGDPDAGVNPSYTALLQAVDAAQSSVQLSMGYFAPGPDFVQALSNAARRGVQVALLLPGQSDARLVLYAARSHYAQLLDAGVQIHEMQHAVMHAKTAVVDGVFSTVGSSNLDWRSIVDNNEIDVIVLGEDFGQAMQDLFARDIEVSRAITPEQWARRGLGERLLEGIGRLIEPLL